MKTRRVRRDEQGSTLILCLVFIALFGTVVGVMLSFGSASLKLNTSETTRNDSLYAADGGIQYATSALQASSPAGTCPDNLTGSGLTLNSSLMSQPADVSNQGGVNVTCQQLTGPGSNNFGGYAVIAGVNVSNSATPSYSINSQSGGCVSMSSDAVPTATGAPQPTLAQGTGTCLTYNNGASASTWIAASTPANGTNLTGAFEYDTLDQWYVGTSGPNPVVWYYDGDDLEVATGTGLPSGPMGFTPAKVWASDPADVWTVGTTGDPMHLAGAVYFSSTTPNAATGGAVSWTAQTISGAKTLTGIYGISKTTLWAVGTTSTGGAVWSSVNGGATWTLAATLANSSAATAVYAADATHVWVSGTSTATGAVWSCVAAVAPCTWSTASQITGTTALNDIRGTNAQHIWTVGVGGGKGAISSSADGVTWSPVVTSANTTGFNAVTAVDATDIWVVGTTSGPPAAGIIEFCNGLACTPTAAGQTLPTPAPTSLTDISGITVSGNFVVTAVGPNPTVLTYAPTTNGAACGAACPANIEGGDVYNADALNLASGLQVTSGDFNQFFSSCPSPLTTPSKLSITAGSYKCATGALPSAIMHIQENLPSAKPAAPKSQTGTSVTVGGTCGSFTYFTPGTYTKQINLNSNGGTYYFESGVYNFEAGFTPLDNGGPMGGTAPYVIGGQPSPGDVNQIAKNSPCWSSIVANAGGVLTDSAHNSSGTGVEWILSKDTWLDVHTVNLELFTREGGNPATEGAQGLSVRDVSGVASGNAVWGSDLSSGIGGQNQIFQVDAAGHFPNVFVHGGIYTPNENVEEYTNSAAVTLGPIFANSIEFSFATHSSPQLTVSGGSPGANTAVITATVGTGSSPTRVQAVLPFNISGVLQKDPTQGYSYQVLNPQ